MARGSWSWSVTTVTPRLDPPCTGLTTTGPGSVRTTSGSTASAPRSRRTEWLSVMEAGTFTPVRATTAAAEVLSHASRAAVAEEPTTGSPSSSRTWSREPSSPPAPCRTGQTTSGRRSSRTATRSDPASTATAWTPASCRAATTRRPEAKDTSRSADRPPASTSTSRSAFTPCPWPDGRRRRGAPAAGPARGCHRRWRAGPARP